jgi:hypothetical protein
VEHHVRTARLTDVEPAMRILMRDGDDPRRQRDEADRFRSLLYAPSATVVVAESERRIIGVGVLSIRPTVRRGPFVGTIDELGVRLELGSGADAADAAGVGRLEVASSIIEQLVGSARNKGCTRVEVTDPLATADLALWERGGFAKRGTLLSRAVG